MSSDGTAKQEIYKTLKLCNFCTTKIGFSFIDEEPKSFISKIYSQVWFIGSTLILFLKLIGQIDYAVTKLVTSASVVEFVAGLHIIGYDTMSFGKLLTIWYKRHIFRNLINELADLWPTSNRDSVDIKQKKLSSLRIGQFYKFLKAQNWMHVKVSNAIEKYNFSYVLALTQLKLKPWLSYSSQYFTAYTFWNILGLWLYNLTPVVIYAYHKIQGTPAHLGYIWHLSYPYDKTLPVYHELTFVFETFGGVVSVWAMLGSDILFMTMSSHISMLLQLLHLKIRNLGTLEHDRNNKRFESKDCYQDIISVIKIHQKLIMYGNNLEDAFSLVNLINVLLSSVNICCVVFNILLDPWMAMSNKFFLGAALTQVGILCWYADDIFRSSSSIAKAVYESGWYNNDIRSQRALLVLMQRSQKPLYFTALKFSSITMSTYSSILINSYSYFTLLYTAYRSG